MSDTRAPCRHLQPKGNHAPQNPTWYLCANRGSQVTPKFNCPECPSYAAAKGATPQPEMESDEMADKKRLNWQAPAEEAVAGIEDERPLWLWAEGQIAERGVENVAKQLGLHPAGVSSSVKKYRTRADAEANEPTEWIPEAPTKAPEAPGKVAVTDHTVLVVADTPAQGLTVEGLLAFIGTLETQGRDPVEFCRGFEARARAETGG